MAAMDPLPYPRAKYRPAGDCCILAEFGEGISEEINNRVRAAETVLRQSLITEIQETVPAYRSLLILYDSLSIGYADLVERLKSLESEWTGLSVQPGSLVRIPVVYGGDYGPDISKVASHNGITQKEVARLHTSVKYLVYMTGFAPGFPYLGGMPPGIATPRLKQPRLRVPAGSVGIAGSQTGVYPLESPGGWQIIGRTPVRLFLPEREQPALLSAGDHVEFYPIDESEFEKLSELERHSRVTGPTAAQTESRRSPVLRVLRPGVLTTVQDLGRPGYLRAGIPPSGATDTYALVASNLLAGNAKTDAALEITLWGAQFRFLNASTISVTGADLEPTLNGRTLPMWQTIQVRRGDILTFGTARSGCRAYLALSGGVAVPEVLGSRSTFARAGMGGADGRSLTAGDDLACYTETNLAGRGMYRLEEELVPSYSTETVLRVVLGPQSEAITSEGIKMFLSRAYRVTTDSDRMGCRLEGPPISIRGSTDIITDGTPAGAVQVFGDGKPVLLLADRQTAGGYAKIAVVIAADLDRAGQLKPGDSVRFESVNLEEANRAHAEYVRRFERLNRICSRGR